VKHRLDGTTEFLARRRDLVLSLPSHRVRSAGYVAAMSVLQIMTLAEHRLGVIGAQRHALFTARYALRGYRCRERAQELERYVTTISDWGIDRTDMRASDRLVQVLSLQATLSAFNGVAAEAETTDDAARKRVLSALDQADAVTLFLHEDTADCGAAELAAETESRAYAARDLQLRFVRLCAAADGADEAHATYAAIEMGAQLSELVARCLSRLDRSTSH
jgi:hypothetical protein